MCWVLGVLRRILFFVVCVLGRVDCGDCKEAVVRFFRVEVRGEVGLVFSFREKVIFEFN